MGEMLNRNETVEQAEADFEGFNVLKQPEQALPSGEPTKNSAENDNTDKVEAATEQVEKAAEQQSDAAEVLKKLEAEETTPRDEDKGPVSAAVRKSTLRNEISHLQRKESLPDRLLSKVIHQPAVRVLSEAAGKTISRPSGLLGGGLVAFLGSSAYIYLAKHIGFTYNYFVFIFLFVVGFGVGLVLEFVVWLALSSKRHQQN